VGYCLGGTLLGLAVAALSRQGTIKGAERIAPLASMTLLAAQLDFSDPGELGVFIDEPQVALLEDIMAEQGFLTGRQMGACFQFLKARDLFWSARIREYWLGQPDVINDLMFWNADVTRMPASMHSEYLHKFYLHNALALGQYEVDDVPISLSDIRLPVFAVGTVKDHVTPWQSAYEVSRLTQSEVTFILATMRAFYHRPMPPIAAINNSPCRWICASNRPSLGSIWPSPSTDRGGPHGMHGLWHTALAPSQQASAKPWIPSPKPLALMFLSDTTTESVDLCVLANEFFKQKP
jgi:polyhydroxyalkanoate synthase